MQSGYRVERIFLAAEGVLYLGFLMIDWFRQDMYILSDFLKYTGIIGCTFYIILRSKNAVSLGKCRKMKTAGLFLVMADFFLLFTEQYIYGVLLFLAVQFCYFNYILPEQGKGCKEKRKTMMFRAGGSVFLGACLWMAGIPIDLLLMLCIFYFFNFLGNVLEAGRLPFKTHRLFIIGVLLFFLCDIHVAVFNASAYVAAGFGFMEKIAAWAMWFYYLPGQVLLALSSIWEG